MSLLLHLAIVVALALGFDVSRPASRTVEETDVSLVLVTPAAAIRRSLAERAQDGSPGGAPSSPSVGGASSLALALPSAAQSPDHSSLTSLLPKEDASANRFGEGLLEGLSAPGRGRPRILPGLGDEAILAEEEERRRRFDEQGPLGKVSIFGTSPAWGRSFVFLIDRSKSMGNEGLGVLEAAAKELIVGLAGLASEHRFQVIAYNHSTHYFTGRSLEPATPDNIERAARFVANLPAFGRTEHFMGLASALALEPDIVFLLTDGGEPQLTEAQLRTFARLNQGRTGVYCLHFSAQGKPFVGDSLRQLAEGNGGEYRQIVMP
jgi:hypothetical protein